MSYRSAAYRYRSLFVQSVDRALRLVLLTILAACSAPTSQQSGTLPASPQKQSVAMASAADYCGTFAVADTLERMLRLFADDAKCSRIQEPGGAGIIRYSSLGATVSDGSVPNEGAVGYLITVDAYADTQRHAPSRTEWEQLEGGLIAQDEIAALSTQDTPIFALSRGTFPSDPMRDLVCVFAGKTASEKPDIHIKICRTLPAAADDVAGRQVARTIIHRLLPQVTALPVKAVSVSDATYCDLIRITGPLQADLVVPQREVTCSPQMTNERNDGGMRASVLTWTGPSKSQGTLDLLLNVIVYDRYVPMSRMQPAVPEGLAKHTVTRLFIGRESELSSGDIHVQLLSWHNRELSATRLCIAAFRTPEYQRPLDITFCRTYDGHFVQADQWAAFKRMAQDDLPQIVLR